MALVVDVLHVTGGAVWFAACGAVTGSAGRARRGAVDGVEGQVTTVAREAAVGVAFDTSDDLHTLIMQRMKLITTPLLL